MVTKRIVLALVDYQNGVLGFGLNTEYGQSEGPQPLRSSDLQGIRIMMFYWTHEAGVQHGRTINEVRKSFVAGSSLPEDRDLRILVHHVYSLQGRSS